MITGNCVFVDGRRHNTCALRAAPPPAQETIMIFRSPFPNVTVPDITYSAFVLQHAQHTGGRPVSSTDPPAAA
jgi:hypothetical protein